MHCEMHVQIVRFLNDSLKPEKHGLFCERIFGPLHSFKCSCGKKSIKNQKFCPECEVLFTTSKMRRYQLGYIVLFSPVIHIWYLKSRPSYCSLLLNYSRKKTESLTYCSELLLMNIFANPFENFLSSEKVIKKYDNRNQILKDIKNTLILSAFKSPRRFLRKRRLNSFYWNIVFKKLSPIKSYIEQKCRIKRKKNLQFNKFKYILNKQSVYAKNQFAHFSSLLEDKENSQYSKKFYSQSLIDQSSIYSRFGRHSYLISSNLEWRNSIAYTHFLYYLQINIRKNDIIISFYKKSIQNLLHLRAHLNTGAPTIQTLLSDLHYFKNIRLLERQLRVSVFNLGITPEKFDATQQLKYFRRLKLIWYFRNSKMNPSWIALSNLPVLPPDLRPIIQLEGNQIAISDLNKLYQKVLFRNFRVQKLQIAHYFYDSDEMQYAQRLLQEAIDALIENGNTSSVTENMSSGDKPLKSLSDIVKGKKGRFRQNLLGKRVDYSGRSVIVVGPSLLLHECGLPREMAIELFQPFLIRRLLFARKARTILGAKQLLQNADPLINDVLIEVLNNHPILLNRAPTLHRLNIQAFRAKLVDGRAILLHPLVCASFNADFDGDQMAIHIPLSFEARSEAWKLMWSRNNLLSPATGLPILVPTQDMILGCYFLTVWDFKKFYFQLLKSIQFNDLSQPFLTQKDKSTFYITQTYKNFTEVILYFLREKIDFQTLIWITWKGLFESELRSQKIIEIQITDSGYVHLLSTNFEVQFNYLGKKISQLIRTTVGRILFHELMK